MYNYLLRQHCPGTHVCRPLLPPSLPPSRRNPLASLQRGRPTSWMVLLHSGSPPQAAFDQFCDLVALHGGRCTCLDEADAHAELLAVLAAQNGENVERDGGSCAVEVGGDGASCAHAIGGQELRLHS